MVSHLNKHASMSSCTAGRSINLSPPSDNTSRFSNDSSEARRRSHGILMKASILQARSMAVRVKHSIDLRRPVLRRLTNSETPSFSDRSSNPEEEAARQPLRIRISQLRATAKQACMTNLVHRGDEAVNSTIPDHRAISPTEEPITPIRALAEGARINGLRTPEEWKVTSKVQGWWHRRCDSVRSWGNKLKASMARRRKQKEENKQSGGEMMAPAGEGDEIGTSGDDDDWFAKSPSRQDFNALSWRRRPEA